MTNHIQTVVWDKNERILYAAGKSVCGFSCGVTLDYLTGRPYFSINGKNSRGGDSVSIDVPIEKIDELIAALHAMKEDIESEQ